MNKAFFENIEKTLLLNLDNGAKQEIKIAVCWFTNNILFNKVLEKKRNGIDVKIILSDDKINFYNYHIDFQKIIELGGVIRVSKYPYLMHNKFCIIDNRVLITGSYNWTKRAEKINFENIIISTDTDLINSFNNEFIKLEEKTKIIYNVKNFEFHQYGTTDDIGKEYNILIEVNQSNSKEEKNSNYPVYKKG